MGGGSLMTPILVFLFGIPPSTAIGTDIAHGAVFKTVGAVQHRRMGNVRARLAGWMLIGSAPRRCVGVWLNVQLTERYGDEVEVRDGAGARRRAALRRGRADREEPRPDARPVGDPDWTLTTRDRSPRSSSALLGGFIVGLTSVGSGVFFGLTLLVVFPLRAHKVVGTDIFHAAVLLYVAGAAHWAAGNIDFGILFWLLLGSIPGVLIGGRLTLSIPEQRLRLLLAGVLGLAGIKLLNVPGAGTIVVVVLSAGAVALLVWLARHSWIRFVRGRGGGSLRRASSAVASRRDANGLGQLRHDRSRLPRGGGRRRRGDRRRRHAARPDRPEPLGAVLLRRGRGATRRRARSRRATSTPRDARRRCASSSRS